MATLDKVFKEVSVKKVPNFTGWYQITTAVEQFEHLTHQHVPFAALQGPFDDSTAHGQTGEPLSNAVRTCQQQLLSGTPTQAGMTGTGTARGVGCSAPVCVLQQGNEEALVGQVRQQFRMNMHETDEAKVNPRSAWAWQCH
jgi:hypothetical protein